MKLSIITLMLFCSMSGYAQKECDGGNKDPNHNPSHHQDPLDDTTTSGGISADQTKSLVLRAMIPSVGSASTMC